MGSHIVQHRCQHRHQQRLGADHHKEEITRVLTDLYIRILTRARDLVLLRTLRGVVAMDGFFRFTFQDQVPRDPDLSRIDACEGLEREGVCPGTHWATSYIRRRTSSIIGRSGGGVKAQAGVGARQGCAFGHEAQPQRVRCKSRPKLRRVRRRKSENRDTLYQTPWSFVFRDKG